MSFSGCEANESKPSAFWDPSTANSLDLARPKLRARPIGIEDIIHHGTHASHRAWRSGPELNLLTEFLGALSIVAPGGTKLKLFHQPRIESGFPDVVLVVWNPSIANKWPEQRKALTHFDLRLLQYLVTCGEASFESIRSTFGRQSDKSLIRLREADTLAVKKRSVKPRSLSQIFAVSRIISVEAKVHDWKSVLSQAVLNTWFSDESWVLMPSKLTERVSAECALHQGVRCLSTNDTCHDLTGLAGPSKPISYGSWLFNEWAWKINRDI